MYVLILIVCCVVYSAMLLTILALLQASGKAERDCERMKWEEKYGTRSDNRND